MEVGGDAAIRELYLIVQRRGLGLWPMLAAWSRKRNEEANL